MLSATTKGLGSLRKLAASIAPPNTPATKNSSSLLFPVVHEVRDLRRQACRAEMSQGATDPKGLVAEDQEDGYSEPDQCTTYVPGPRLFKEFEHRDLGSDNQTIG